ncbi:heavy metal-associated domain-containing protein, partial [Ruminococcus sp. D55t1_190419_H1]|uniref:cation transporter n=1 Tax=Ruminococcus sp. D55t1_190419_H1 TaxID=2787130 RepID=UPI00189BA841
MKKTYKIDVDCANCANLMEDAARKTSGVQSATVNFMTLKMNVEFEEGQDPKTVMHNIINLRKKWKGICSQVPFIVLKYRQ